MKTTLSSFVYLFDELLNTIEEIGVENTIKALQEAKSASLILTDFNIDFIIQSVANTTALTRDRIINGKDKSDERKIATALCVHFIKNELNYSYRDISKILNKDISQLSRYNSYIKSMPPKPKTEFDKKLETYLKQMKLLISEKKLNS